MSDAGFAAGIEDCRRCGLWRGATQGVAGEGPLDADLMLVGEQPGDQEDVAGRPFVGPAGRVLDQALVEAGVTRETVFITNAVKHFKHEMRGKRRLHKTPNTSEIQACRWWLDEERARVRPKVIVAMGGTAVKAVFGRTLPIMRSRGRGLALDDAAQGVITIHPSYLLRIPERHARAVALAGFVADLRLARSLL